MALPKIYLIIPNEVDLILADIERRAKRNEDMTLEEYSTLINNFNSPDWNGIYIATMYEKTLNKYENDWISSIRYNHDYTRKAKSIYTVLM
ncbi:hypothetical protein TVAGG3_0132690 [Trichomonas vaginalis G3]|uniref:hypothetical protein n=1 Tax=Trichomonas vaginalis (strain ATCC PRA-98 / G3) TaxID=412133 RepID=UPI0021E59433|nr:hypothetical protein TVAGG3_0132690 [Trichomonas vaginalis G3]KAI5546204.1 hypothetical protein TVAGG3_0132690 [Trichomonas vaginalis G3]